MLVAATAAAEGARLLDVVGKVDYDVVTVAETGLLATQPFGLGQRGFVRWPPIPATARFGVAQVPERDLRQRLDVLVQANHRTGAVGLPDMVREYRAVPVDDVEGHAAKGCVPHRHDLARVPGVAGSIRCRGTRPGQGC